MKKHLLNTTVLLVAVSWANVAVAQQCCIYSQVGGTLSNETCTQPANGIICASQAYNWSPSEGAVNPDAPDKLGTSGIGIFREVWNGGAATCGNPTCVVTIILPVEFTSFDARYVGEGQVELEWETASESNNAGFYIERQVGSVDFQDIAFVEGNGTTTDANVYAFRVTGLDAGHHSFRLKQVDFDGAVQYSAVVEATVELPGTFVLEPAYPNPFNPSTTIRFGTAVETELTVELYDASGKLVQTLYEGVPEAGALNTITIDGSGLTSGTYLVKLSSTDFQTSQSIVLLK